MLCRPLFVQSKKNASPIYLRQHKSAQPSTANVVESITPPISSHSSTVYSSCVPGKGELEGEKWASQLRTPFPLVTLPTQQCPPERKNFTHQCHSNVQFMPAASRLSRRETFIYASVSSRNCGIGVIGGIGGSSNSPDIFR